jgi:hypothetical protein
MRGIVQQAAGLLALALLAGSAQAKPVKLKVTPVAHGSVEDEKLMAEAPKSGVITDRKTFEKVLKAWKASHKVKVDFRKQIVLVATTRGGRLLPTNATLEDGNLKFVAGATRDLKPGFRYSIGAVPREGVMTVNGKKLGG